MFGSAMIFSLVLMLSAGLAAAQDKFQSRIPIDQSKKLENGRTSRLTGKADDAIRELKPLVDTTPDYYAANYNLGLVYADRKDYVTATRYLERALEIKKKENIKDATIFNSLGWVYMLAGWVAKAEAYFKEGEKNAEQLNDTSKRRLYDNMGWLYMNSGDLQQAEKYFSLSSQQFDSSFAAQNLQVIDTVKQTKLRKGAVGETQIKTGK